MVYNNRYDPPQPENARFGRRIIVYDDRRGIALFTVHISHQALMPLDNRPYNYGGDNWVACTARSYLIPSRTQQ